MGLDKPKRLFPADLLVWWDCLVESRIQRTSQLANNREVPARKLASPDSESTG